MSKEAKEGVLGTSTISYKFQITIPKKARDRFGLEEGDVVLFIEQGSRLYLAKGSEILFPYLPPEEKQKALAEAYPNSKTDAKSRANRLQS